MRFTVYTLFPGLITAYLGEALMSRAVREGIVTVEARDLRRFAGNRTGRVDDTPYGGGAGMVMRVDVAAAAIEEASRDEPEPDEVILFTPAGERLDQGLVTELATKRHLCLLSARYEGFDARVERLVTREVSIGDFVVMGGELPSLVLMEAVTRLLPGALGDADSHRQESFTTGLLDYPEYTRPLSFAGVEVPEVLLSGHHGNVATWRREQALRRTLERRPDLLAHLELSDAERRLLSAWGYEIPD
ncbi:MAG TPA: tRNA (guanosine(37)-N1)-methyltransferase TrmD [Trueperaceae bacterium]|nr:tRNA (guanosine(37)-N1)-methyltransferase TrmD [Trueperaceae bacterium]